MLRLDLIVGAVRQGGATESNAFTCGVISDAIGVNVTISSKDKVKYFSVLLTAKCMVLSPLKITISAAPDRETEER